MSHKIVGVQVDLKGGDVRLTTLTESPRGTRIRLASVMVKGVRGDKAVFEGNILTALHELVPGLNRIP